MFQTYTHLLPSALAFMQADNQPLLMKCTTLLIIEYMMCKCRYCTTRRTGPPFNWLSPWNVQLCATPQRLARKPALCEWSVAPPHGLPDLGVRTFEWKMGWKTPLRTPPLAETTSKSTDACMHVDIDAPRMSPHSPVCCSILSSH